MSRVNRFCKLMDAKKSGIRIKPAKLREDQKRWDQDKDPTGNISKPSLNRETTGVMERSSDRRSMEPSAFILDVLVNVGSGFLKDEVDAFKTRLQVYRDSDFNAESHSNILDEDLRRPWAEARKWTRGEKGQDEELDLITTTVRECLDRFMKMTAKHIETKPSPRKQQEGLQAIVRYYASTPALEDLPLLAAGPDGGAQVARIKASYAYLCDLVRIRQERASGWVTKWVCLEDGNGRAWEYQRRRPCRIQYAGNGRA
jgi:hypothetical protein